MDAKLKERAKEVAQLRNHNQRFTQAQFQEIGEVHHLLTGKTVKCVSCNVYSLLNEINAKLIKEPLKIKKMSAKIQFKHNAPSVEVIRHTKNGTVLITKENLNEGDNAAFMAKNYGHLVEETKAAKAEANEETASKTSTKK